MSPSSGAACVATDPPDLPAKSGLEKEGTPALLTNMFIRMMISYCDHVEECGFRGGVERKRIKDRLKLRWFGGV
jgi:hypothetical protein